MDFGICMSPGTHPLQVLRQLCIQNRSLFHFWYCIRGLLFLSSFGSVSSHFGPHCRMWESLLCLGIELMPWTLGAWSRNHGTPKEVPRGEFSVGSEDLSCGLIDLSLIFLSSFFSFLFSLGLHGIFLVS